MRSTWDSVEVVIIKIKKLDDSGTAPYTKFFMLPDFQGIFSRFGNAKTLCNLRIFRAKHHNVTGPVIRERVPATVRASVCFGEEVTVSARFFRQAFSPLRASSIHSNLPSPGCRMVRPIFPPFAPRFKLTLTIRAMTLSPSLSERFDSFPYKEPFFLS